MKKYFQIGEISRLYGVGVDTIRYYERIGLIRPRRSEGGYRLYRPQDIWRLNVIRDLRELGFPTEVIKDYLDFQNVDSALRLLEEEQRAIEAKLEMLRGLEENVRSRRETIAAAQALPLGQIRLRTLPPRRCFRTEQGYSSDEEMDLLMQELLSCGSHPYIIGSNQFGSFLTRRPDGSLCYRSVFAIDPTGDHTIPGGSYLCVSYQGSYDQSQLWVRRLLEQAKALNLRPGERLLEILWIDIHTSRDEQEHITELQLPVSS